MVIHTEQFNGISLCSGYGGLEIGITIAEPGYRTVCFVEREAHAAATLVARMADEALDQAPVWDDVKTFDGKPWRGKIHILSAGYPCQPFSFSGKRKGKKDPRHLWPDIARIIREVEPQTCFFENVEGHLNLGAAEVIAGLQGMGFDVKAGLFSAAETGASHQRRRLFIMANANDKSLLLPGTSGIVGRGVEVSKRSHTGRQSIRPRAGCENMDFDVSDTEGGRSGKADEFQLPLFAPAPYQFADWDEILCRRPDLQPELFRLDHGLADRVERSRAAGNGVASLVAAYAWRTLKTSFSAS